jgi:S1-C subfamily serine protease
VDYERYLQADGRPTAIPVRDVLASSPAERSGLQPGDEIVAYGGKRVFDMGELNALTLEGVPGESVVVDVRRNGQSLQLVMPRGPLGVTGGGFRGR